MPHVPLEEVLAEPLDSATAADRRAAVAAYLDHLAVERGLAANTLAAYRRDLRPLRRQFCARAGIADARRGRPTATSPRTWPRCARATTSTRRWRRRPRPARSCAVRGLHRFAAREGLDRRRPGRGGPAADAAARLPKALGVDEVERLLGGGRRRRRAAAALRDRALLEFLYGTGARISEAVGLRRRRPRPRPTAAVLLRGKGGKERLVPVGGYAARGAARPTWCGRRPGAGRPAGRRHARRAVPQRPRRARCRRQSAWAILRAAAERAGLPATAERVAAHAAALVRHPPARRRRRRPGGAGAARARLGDHHPGLHLVTVDQLREVYADRPPARPLTRPGCARRASVSDTPVRASTRARHARR